jgi:hypothetical protein
VKYWTARLVEHARRLLVETDAKGLLVSYGFSLKVAEKNKSTTSPNAHPWTLTSYRAAVSPRAARVRIREGAVPLGALCEGEPPRRNSAAAPHSCGVEPLGTQEASRIPDAVTPGDLQ